MSGLCSSGESSATIKGNTTVKQDKAAGATNTAAEYVQHEQNPTGAATPPDFSDNLIQEARKRQAAQLLTKSNRRDALANNAGAPSPASYSLLK